MPSARTSHNGEQSCGFMRPVYPGFWSHDPGTNGTGVKSPWVMTWDVWEMGRMGRMRRMGMGPMGMGRMRR